jgi:hypothetical protein
VADHPHSARFPGVDPSRRSFITKFAAAVFAVPAISTFALDGIAQAKSSQHGCEGSQCHIGNQSICNQFFHNQSFCNQCISNQCLCDQQLSNQSCGNQTGDEKCGPDENDPEWWKFGECFPFDNHDERRRSRFW